MWGAGVTRTESTKTMDGRKLIPWDYHALSRAITRAEMPRGVAVASIARLPSSTDDPRASGSTADRHETRPRVCLPNHEQMGMDLIQTMQMGSIAPTFMSVNMAVIEIWLIKVVTPSQKWCTYWERDWPT